MTMSFIEKQFPVSKVSKESYKERTAAQSQTLTGLGKWWGRKPLILVRAAILGCLMPTSDNPARDMEVFLKIMSMDENGLWQRYKQQQNKSSAFWEKNESEMKEKFFKLGYDEKIGNCVRPEQYVRPQDDFVWDEVNQHLGTNAFCLEELVEELSRRMFGKKATIGDCFCGGGSIPFEAARMGLNIVASDLNPIATLLTWASINVCSTAVEDMKELREIHKTIYDEVDQEIIELGIEHNEKGDRALSYIYCSETICPECGTQIPLLPTLVIGKRAGNVIVNLKKNGNKYDINVISNVSTHELQNASNTSTISANALVCPNCRKSTPINVLRRDSLGGSGDTNFGLRRWSINDFEPKKEDIFSERLYAIRYEHEYIEAGKVKTKRYYRAPNEHDMKNEEVVRSTVAKNFSAWQSAGVIPDMEIESGYNTDQLIRERGWSYWHHLFNARQLLMLSLLMKKVCSQGHTLNRVLGLLGVGKCANFGSKLCRWTPLDKSVDVFYNQALNTLFNWSARSFKGLGSSWFFDIYQFIARGSASVQVSDARIVDMTSEIWITDPPYADAVNYHELSEFFLAWYRKALVDTFPEWYSDSKRILAVRGGDDFALSMIDIYTNITNHMPANGLQIVMFTHSDPAVWAQLALIMWKAGLRVTAAWNISTETESGGLKDGNYVKGTVLLVLRKQTVTNEAFLDEINADIKAEVVNQINSMQELDDQEDPNFSDPDYVLAAYAASLKVLTSYASIGELDLDYELDKAIHDPSNSQVVALIQRATKQAYDVIIPRAFVRYLWRDLSPAERFYVKGLEYEKAGGYQVSTYQEYARGFAISNYSQMMANEKANTARLKTPSEFAMRTVNEVPGFEDSILRLVLAAIHIAITEDEQPGKGLWHLKNNLVDYWASREMLKQLLLLIRETHGINNMPHWQEAAKMAEHLHNLVEHDHV